MSSTRKFARGDKKNFSNEEKLALRELVEKYKKEFDEEVKLNEGEKKVIKKEKSISVVCLLGAFLSLSIYYTMLTLNLLIPSFCMSFQI